MQNNHDVSSIELLCLYLANSQNSIHYITVVIRLHLLMQNNHGCYPPIYCAYTWPRVTIRHISPWLLGFTVFVPSIELLGLYLGKSVNLTHDIIVASIFDAE